MLGLRFDFWMVFASFCAHAIYINWTTKNTFFCRGIWRLFKKRVRFFQLAAVMPKAMFLAFGHRLPLGRIERMRFLRHW